MLCKFCGIGSIGEVCKNIACPSKSGKSLSVRESYKVEYSRDWPALVERVAKLSKPSDTGVGDTVERILAKFGGTQFKWLMDRLGVNCGCEDRKRYLNRVFPY